ncbi:MAG: dUTP diphosphatase [Dehalococcoidia bacterium]|nr:dUTP diphosphatase [Dehalococcoidia bacterium]
MSGAQVLRVKLLRPGARIPVRATPGATGYDLVACLPAGPDAGAALEVGQAPVRVPTGIAIEAPDGWDVQIRPRSGLSVQGVMAVFGTIDSDFRGELLVTMYVLPYRGPHAVRHGDRIAQLVVSRIAEVSLEVAEELSATARDAGGHGSTGR